MISALYANTNYDMKENQSKRDQILQRIEEGFNQTTINLYNGSLTEQQKEQQKEEEEYQKNPFFNQVEKGLKNQGVPELKEFLDEEDWNSIDQH